MQTTTSAFPYNAEQGFYNPNHKVLDDGALPVTVQRISHLKNQTRASTNRNMGLGATAETTSTHTRLLEKDYPWTCHLTYQLHKDLATARAGMGEYQERHSTLEDRVIAVEVRTIMTKHRTGNGGGHSRDVLDDGVPLASPWHVISEYSLVS